MLASIAALLLVQAPSAAVSTVAVDRIATAASATPADVDNLTVRLTSPQGVLWQGNVRVTQNQGASYSQNFSQASPTACSNTNSYDRSERSSVSLNVYLQNNGSYGMVYRVDASWQRPSEDSDCGERGTRTVQVAKGIALNPGETGVIEGDAGLRVEITRNR